MIEFIFGVLTGVVATIAAAVLAFAIAERRTAKRMRREWGNDAR